MKMMVTDWTSKTNRRFKDVLVLCDLSCPVLHNVSRYSGTVPEKWNTVH